MMKVAISQPEHFPYLGYFQKMMCCDIFVLLDDVQFSGPRSFQNRNRFTNTNNAQQWFTVPVAKKSYFDLIKDVKVAPDFGWRKKLVRTMEQNFGRYNFEDIYSGSGLADINIKSINLCREVLGIKTPIIKSSELSVGGIKSEKIYNLCKKLKADTYISGQGAREYMEKQSFDGIKIQFIEPSIPNFDSTISLLKNGSSIKNAMSFCDVFMEKFNVKS